MIAIQPSAAEEGHVDALPEDELPTGGEATHSVWRSPIAWALLLPLLFFAAGGFPFSQNSPDTFLQGSASVLTEPSIEPFGTQLQTVMWIISVPLMLTFARPTFELLLKSRLILSLMFLIFISAFWADNTVESLRRGFLLNLTLLLGVYLSARFSREEQLSLIFGVGVFSIIGSYFAAIFLPLTNAGFTGEWQGMFGNKNDLGMYIFFLLSPMFFMRPTRLSIRIFHGVVLASGLVLVALSGSRGGWVVGVIFFAYVASVSLLNRFERRNALLIVTVSLPLVAGLFALLSLNLDRIAYALGKDPGLTNRTLIWEAVWPSILKRPILGYGYGGFWNGISGESGNVLLRLGTSLVHAHNGLLNTWLQIGLVGVCIALAITLIGIKDAFTSFGLTSNRAFFWYGAILLLTIAANVEESSFLRHNTLVSTLWVLACLELRKTALQQKSGIIEAQSKRAGISHIGGVKPWRV